MRPVDPLDAAGDRGTPEARRECLVDLLDDAIRRVKWLPNESPYREMLAELRSRRALALRGETPSPCKDTVRLDWLERVGFATTHVGGEGPHDAPGVHSWRRPRGGWGWTAHWISAELPNCRAAIDAAMAAAELTEVK